MKTLAIRQPYAALILAGAKTIEVRSWPTAHRGPMLIVASGKPLQIDIDGESATLPAGCQVCIADVTGCRPLTAADLEAAYLPDDFDPAGQFAWTLANVREVAPAPHKGRLRLYDTPDATISPLMVN